MAQHPRPIIGINADFVPAGKVTSAHVRLNSDYCDRVEAAGGLPVIIPPLGKEAGLDGLLDRLDGVILSGGLDIDPTRARRPSHPAVQPVAERREFSDRLLVRAVVARQLPILAIGFGMQQLNVACGGTLYLHLPDQQPQSLPHGHPADGPHRHAVLLEPNTRIAAVCGGGEIRVASAHHQAVRQVGACLRISARAADGIIEAIEAVDPNWFCVGVQWHPESDTASGLDRRLFECFVQNGLGRIEPLAQAA